MKTLMSPRDLAAELGIKEETLAQWRWQGKGPRFIKVGRLVRYHREDVAAWIAKRARTSTADQGALS